METSIQIRTSLFNNHIALGAKMVEYSGFNMPVSYEGLLIEHKAVRENSGMFDVSHMGEFIIEGPDAIDFLQSITSNDVSKLSDGKIQYSCLPNYEGGIVDDLLVYRFSETRYMLVVNAGNIRKDLSWILNTSNTYEVNVQDTSEDWSLIALQGPDAIDKLSVMTDVDLESLKYYTFCESNILGTECIISATGYTGSGGFELYIPNHHASVVWDALLKDGVTPCGLGARDTLRLEMGFCLYGNDIDDTTNPIEAGLGWITKFNKTFTNSEKLQVVKSEGTPRKLIGVKMSDRGIPRKGYEVVNSSGEVVGTITSGTMSPSLGIGIGMCYLDTLYAKEGNKLFVRIRNKDVAVEVVKFPFLK